MGRSHDITISGFDLDRIEAQLKSTKTENARLRDIFMKPTLNNDALPITGAINEILIKYASALSEIVRLREELVEARNHEYAGELKAAHDEIARLREDRRRLDGLESIPHQLAIVCKQSRPKTEGMPTLREQIDLFLSNTQDDPPRSGG